MAKLKKFTFSVTKLPSSVSSISTRTPLQITFFKVSFIYNTVVFENYMLLFPSKGMGWLVYCHSSLADLF